MFNSLLHSTDDGATHMASISPSSQLSKFPLPALGGIMQYRRKHEGSPLSLLSQVEKKKQGAPPRTIDPKANFSFG